MAVLLSTLHTIAPLPHAVTRYQVTTTSSLGATPYTTINRSDDPLVISDNSPMSNVVTVHRHRGPMTHGISNIRETSTAINRSSNPLSEAALISIILFGITNCPSSNTQGSLRSIIQSPATYRDSHPRITATQPSRNNRSNPISNKITSNCEIPCISNNPRSNNLLSTITYPGSEQRSNQRSKTTYNSNKICNTALTLQPIINPCRTATYSCNLHSTAMSDSSTCLFSTPITATNNTNERLQATLGLT